MRALARLPLDWPTEPTRREVTLTGVELDSDLHADSYGDPVEVTVRSGRYELAALVWEDGAVEAGDAWFAGEEYRDRLSLAQRDAALATWPGWEGEARAEAELMAAREGG